jgi:hypothetical protein
MNRKLISLLLMVCAVLVLIILGEWLYAAKAQRDLLASTSSTAKKAAPDEMPTLALTKQPEESYDQLVNRPLFIKGRKPVDEPKPESAQVPVANVVFDWELNGVYTKNKSLSALFSRAKTKVAKDNYRKITVGTELDGWKLTEIKTDRAIFKQGGNQKEVLLRKAKPKSPLPQNRPAPPMPQSAPMQGNIPIPETIPVPESPEGSFENNIDEQ